MKVMMSKSLEARINKETLESHFNDNKDLIKNFSIDIEDVRRIKREDDNVCIKFSSSVLDIERTEFLINLSLSNSLMIVDFQINGNKKYSDKSFTLAVTKVSSRISKCEDRYNRFSIEGSLLK